MVESSTYSICASCKHNAAIDCGTYGICYFCNGRFSRNR